ncbi:MAG: fibronectin type III domain-containing protein, partial [Chloroflexota bacterium]
MRRLIIPVLALVVLLSGLPLAAAQHYLSYTDDNGLLIEPVLLTDPFLQMPTEDSVNVVWFTEFDTGRNVVLLQDGSEIAADTFKMSRIREDNGSWIFREEERSALFDAPTMRNIWRHEATVGDLEPGERVGYSVMSVFPGGEDVTSETFTLAPLPEAGQPLNILLTSDHQNMPMVAANLQMVEAVYGTGGIDAVLLAGDLVNIPDRAGEWFDYGDGGGFFKSLQGNSERDVEWYGGANTFTGGEIIQHAPLFPATGNHEVMGRYHPATPGLNEQYNRPRPVAATEALYEANRAIINPDDDPAVRERFIEDNSFNTITYEEIFSLPDDSPG